LSIGNALSVRAVRTHAGLRKNDWTLNFGPDGWRRTQAPLLDDEIRVIAHLKASFSEQLPV